MCIIILALFEIRKVPGSKKYTKQDFHVCRVTTKKEEFVEIPQNH
jgi:hypothetical protein